MWFRVESTRTRGFLADLCKGNVNLRSSSPQEALPDAGAKGRSAQDL